MLHEERTANILINKAGGNAGPDAKGYRVALPSAWMKALGISEGSRTVTLQFDGESITIRRPAVSDYDGFSGQCPKQRSRPPDPVLLRWEQALYEDLR